MQSQIATHQSLGAFFRDLLQESLAEERLVLDDQSVAYLLKLFEEFAKLEAMQRGARDGEPGTPTLVWLYERARSAEPTRRFEAYRHLGDVALMVSGFFAPHIERDRSLVGVNYYVQMGSTAYDSAATLSKRTGFGELLSELAAKFRRLVEVLSRVAERTTLPVSKDAGALYTRLLRNPESAHLHQRLIGQGLIPMVGARGVLA